MRWIPSDIVVSILDNLRTQRYVELEMVKGRDRMILIKPTYGLQHDRFPFVIFRFTEREVGNFLEGGNLKCTVKVNTRRAN